MRWLPGPETRSAILKHPFFLAGLGVVLLLGIVAGALVLASSLRASGSGDDPTVVIDPVSTSTAGPTSRTAVASGVSGTTKRITAVRAAPGSGTSVLGTMAKGDEVVIDGRTTDARWYRVIYPPNSEVHGWVDAAFLDVTGDPTTLLVATAEPLAAVDVPTQSRSERTTPTPERIGTATPTLTAILLPDLVVGTTPTLAGDKLFVTVVNQGAGDASGDLVVAIFTADGAKLLGGATLPAFTLAAGRSIDVGTNYTITENQTLLLIVDPNGDIEESDDTNNRIVVAIASGGAQPPATEAAPAATAEAPP